jgi:predicted PurR-regulated permease PerM
VNEPEKKNFQIALIGILVVVIVLLVVMCYLLFTHDEATAIIRDISVIILALESIVVLLLLGVVIGMLWWLIQTLEKKITPILDTTNETVNNVSETVNTVRGTATFVSDTVVSPVIKAVSYASGVKKAIQTLTKWRSMRSD